MIASVYDEIFNNVNADTTGIGYINWQDEATDWELLITLWDNLISNQTTTNQYFKQIRVYNGQINSSLNRGIYLYEKATPALFLEINEQNSILLGKQITASDLIIKFHIVITQLDSATGTLDQNIDIFFYRNYIKRIFSKFKLTKGGTFIWGDDDESYIHDNLYHYILTYKCHYIDFLGETNYFPYVPGQNEWTLWNYENILWDDETNNWDGIIHIGGDLQINTTYET